MPCWHLAEIKGKGQGVFVSRDIDAGSQIMSEGPLLYFARPNIPIDDFYRNEHSGQSTFIKEAVATRQGVQLRQLRALHPAVADAIPQSSGRRRQASPQPTDHTKRDIRCFEYNAFSNFEENGDPRVALLVNISRINHSCRPNAHMYLDPSQGRFIIRALEDIDSGEEVTITYSLDEGYRDQAGRRRYYRDHYGFDCACPACPDTNKLSKKKANELSASNKRRKEMKDFHEELRHNAPNNLDMNGKFRAETENQRKNRINQAHPTGTDPVFRKAIHLAASASDLVRYLDLEGIKDSRLVSALYYQTYFNLAADKKAEAYSAAVLAEKATTRIFGSSGGLSQKMSGFEHQLIEKALEYKP